MEKVSVACAMEWSIELEKALRSENPVRILGAIQEIGSRLERWGEEPEPTLAVYAIFGLVPAEHVLFANTIMLRLADAFKLGDKRTKLAIVHIFMSNFKRRRRKRKIGGAKEFFSKERLPNFAELLNRVSSVYDSSDVESRAMSLVLFGCWADFAKDSSRIRHLILTGLVSYHDVEVKASLFSASCICAVADDFAMVILEVLPHMITSSEITLPIRLAAVRVLAKLGCSHSIANKAFKVGQKLLMNLFEDDLLVAALVSLTKLASRSTYLTAEQTDLILSFLHQDKTPHMQTVALRCLHFLLRQGMGYTLVSSNVVGALFSLLERANTSSHIQCKALENLQKLFQYKVHSADASEFTHLVGFVENALHSSFMRRNFEAIQILVYMLEMMAQRENDFAGFSLQSLYSHILILIADQVTLFTKPHSEGHQFEYGSAIEVQRLLAFIYYLVRQIPVISCMVLDKFNFFIESFASMEDCLMETEQASFVADCTVKKGVIIRSKLTYNVLKLLMVCLDNLDAAGEITFLLYEKVKRVVQYVQHCSVFHSFTHVMYTLILHSPILWCSLVGDRETHKSDDGAEISCTSDIYGSEIASLKCAEKLIMERDYWPAYRAGMHASCQGSWITAGFIFEKLKTKVESESCCWWLESLSYIAHAEGKIQFLRSPDVCLKMKSWVAVSGSMNELGCDVGGMDKVLDYSATLQGAYHSLQSCREKLTKLARPTSKFLFQRWFLDLREKTLQTLLDLLKLSTLWTNDMRYDEQSQKGMLTSSCSLQNITKISLRLKNLALEFDLLASSVGIDYDSLKVVLSLALSCAVLAFTAGFAVLIPKLPVHATFISCSLEKGFHSSLFHDLVDRLEHLDSKIIKKLCQLGDITGYPVECSHVQSRNQALNNSGEVKNILLVLDNAVSGIVNLQHEIKKMNNREMLSQITTAGLHILTETIHKWIFIPFRVPKFFFKLRPTVCSELFASSAESGGDFVLVFEGFYLSLNLCLQLRNLIPELCIRPKKLYCLLYCDASYQISCHEEGREKNSRQWSPWEDDEMLKMSKKLFQRVTEPTGSYLRDFHLNSEGVAQAYVCFEPNKNAQGFSSCLLDVSRFPTGSYQIKWHSCFIDTHDLCWNLLPLNPGPVLTVCKSIVD